MEKQDTLEDSSMPDRKSNDNDELARLKQLLFKRELELIETLQQRESSHTLHIKNVSNVIAEAIALRSQHDDFLSKALQPTIEDAIKNSAKESPAEMAQALFPLMGPAIRKSIAEGFRGMLENFNRTIELSLSWKSLRWRLEALKSGRKFSEIVLINTLAYKVEQVFLIHSETGILLGHAISEGVEYQDGDLVSGMLTAIQDFVKSCFTNENNSVDTMQMGDKTLIVETGAKVSMALISRGTLPSDFRNRIRDILDLIHVKMYTELENFNGEIKPFESVHYLLEDCLIQKFLKEDKRLPFVIKAIPVVLLLCILTFVGYSSYRNIVFNNLVTDLEEAHGIIVSSSSGNVIKGWTIHLMRDTYSIDPMALVQNYDIKRLKIFSTPFISLDPHMISKRIKNILKTQNYDVDFDFKNGAVYLKGQAPIEWINDIKTKIMAIPGVELVDVKGINDVRFEQLMQLIKKIEAESIEFPIGGDTPTGVELQKMKNVVDDLVQVAKMSSEMGLSAILIVYGHTDATGGISKNYELSEKRAKTLASMLYSKGVAMPVTTYGFGAKYTVEENRQKSRRIELRVSLNFLGKSLNSFEDL